MQESVEPGAETTPRIATHLVASLIGAANPQILAEVAGRVHEAGGNIEESRGTAIAGQAIVYLSITGNWRVLEKLEGTLQELADEHGMGCIVRRTRGGGDADPAMPYSVDVVALDQPGILRALAGFFDAHSVYTREWQTRVYRASANGTQMLSANLLIDIPADQHLASLRADFMDFCDDLNLDGVLDPVKG